MNKPSVLILFLTMMSLTLFQCEQGDSAEKSNNPYTGVWSIISISGGFAGTGYEADFSRLLIGNDGIYWMGTDTSTVAEGTYQVFKKGENDWIRLDSKQTDNNRHVIEYSEKMIGISIEGTLFMNEPCCDQYSYEFQKIGEDVR